MRHRVHIPGLFAVAKKQKTARRLLVMKAAITAAALGLGCALVAPIVLHAGSAQATGQRSIDSVMAEVTTLQREVQQLKEKVAEQSQMGKMADSVAPRRYGSLGALIRSIPPEVMVDDYQNQLQVAVAQRWFLRYAQGSMVSMVVTMDRVSVDDEAHTVKIRMLSAQEFYDSAPVSVAVECRFVTDNTQTLARLARGGAVKVRGTLVSGGFCAGTTKAARKMYVELDGCELEKM